MWIQKFDIIIDNYIIVFYESYVSFFRMIMAILFINKNICFHFIFSIYFLKILFVSSIKSYGHLDSIYFKEKNRGGRGNILHTQFHYITNRDIARLLICDDMQKQHKAQRSASWETRPKGGYSQLVYIYIYINIWN